MIRRGVVTAHPSFSASGRSLGLTSSVFISLPVSVVCAASARGVSSTPWRPQNLSEVHEVPAMPQREGFEYATGSKNRVMNAENSRILEQMRARMDAKWYEFDPVHVALALLFVVMCYYLGKFVGFMQTSGGGMC